MACSKTTEHNNARHGTQYSPAQRSATQRSAAPHRTAPPRTAQNNSTQAQHSTVQYSTKAQHTSTARHGTARHGMARHGTAQLHTYCGVPVIPRAAGLTVVSFSAMLAIDTHACLGIAAAGMIVTLTRTANRKSPVVLWTQIALASRCDDHTATLTSLHVTKVVR